MCLSFYLLCHSFKMILKAGQNQEGNITEKQIILTAEHVHIFIYFHNESRFYCRSHMFKRIT